MTTSLSHKALAFSIQSLLTEKLTSPSYMSGSGMLLDKRSEDTPRSVSASSVGDSPCSEGSSLYSRDHNSASPRTPKHGSAMSVSSADSSPEDEGTAQEGEEEGALANGKKPRTIFTREQVQRLEEAYTQKRYLTRRERKELAKEADISHTQVKIWFQNRRAKAKLKDRKTMAIMQSALQQQRLYYNGPQSHLPHVPQVPHRVPRVPAHVPQMQSHVPSLPQLQNDSYIKSLLPTAGIDLGSRVARRSKGKSAFSWYNI